MKNELVKRQMARLVKAFAGITDEGECESFLKDLCTISEIRAMAQRLEVARLLKEQHIYSDIAAKTGASTATISRVNRYLLYGSGGYEAVLAAAGEDEDV